MPVGIKGFQKGQSGNPGGRPKENAEVRKLAQDHGKEALEKIIAIMRSSKDGKLILAAAQYILDRGFGKPAQAITGGENDEPAVRLAGVIELVRPGG